MHAERISYKELIRRDMALPLPLRIAREPAFGHPFFLLEQLQDGPETGESDHSDKGGDDDVADKERACRRTCSSQQKDPPATLPEIIFSLDDYRMEDSDDQKSA